MDEVSNLQGYVSLLASVVTSVATFVLAILTAIYVKLTSRLLESQNRPNVQVSLANDPHRASIIQIVIQNTGNGTAFDIEFELSRPIPCRAWGLNKQNANATDQMNSGPLIKGLNSMGPNDIRRLDWGQYGGISKNVGGEPVEVKCSFSDGSKHYTNTCFLEIQSFKGTEANRSVESRIADEIELLRKNIEKLSTGQCKTQLSANDIAPETTQTTERKER